MSGFGSYAILDPVVHTLEKEKGWTWTIKPPTSEDELIVSRLLATERFKIEADGIRTNQYATTIEVAMCELGVTYAGSTVPGAPDAGAPRAEIEMFLKSMPREMLFELWGAMGEAVPGWGPQKKVSPKN